MRTKIGRVIKKWWNWPTHAEDKFKTKHHSAHWLRLMTHWILWHVPWKFSCTPTPDNVKGEATQISNKCWADSGQDGKGGYWILWQSAVQVFIQTNPRRRERRNSAIFKNKRWSDSGQEVKEGLQMIIFSWIVHCVGYSNHALRILWNNSFWTTHTWNKMAPRTIGKGRRQLTHNTREHKHRLRHKEKGQVSAPSVWCEKNTPTKKNSRK